jgi:hypothetical protein
MRELRFSIAGLMGIVLVAAVGLTALKSASRIWAGAMLLLTCGILTLGVVGAIYRQGTRRGWWLGFSLFGWGYTALWGFWSVGGWPDLPTTTLLEILRPWLNSPARADGGLFGGRPWGMGFGGGLEAVYYQQAGHCLCSLLAAVLGGLLATFFFVPSSEPSDRPPSDVREPGQPTRSRWLRPTIIGLVVLILIAAAAAIWSGSHGALWAVIAFALTCALIGLAILAAVLGRGRRREIGLGAALFGAGYMALVFGHPAGQPPRVYFATDQILDALRPGLRQFPRIPSSGDVRILEALELSIPMSFAAETPIDDVLKYIKQATTTPDYPGIPIYVDPNGLQRAECSLNSTVQMDLEGIPLRETLRLCLKQLGLAYEVKEGRLRITSEDEFLAPDLEYPFPIVGHCLLALLAAGFGALAAPMIAEARAHSGSSPERT